MTDEFHNPNEKKFVDELQFEVDRNRRVTTRFIREDIEASIREAKKFGSGKPEIIELNDLSTRGALFSIDKELKLNKKLFLLLQFTSGKSFEISGKVVRAKKNINKFYGFKFDQYNDELGDYLLETQTNLVFK